MLLDEARLCLAEEDPPVLDEHAVVWLGSEGRFGGLDRVEPDLADTVPRRLSWRPGLHDTEAQTPHTWQPAHDLGVRTHPVREEILP